MNKIYNKNDKSYSSIELKSVPGFEIEDLLYLKQQKTIFEHGVKIPSESLNVLMNIQFIPKYLCVKIEFLFAGEKNDIYYLGQWPRDRGWNYHWGITITPRDRSKWFPDHDNYFFNHLPNNKKDEIIKQQIERIGPFVSLALNRHFRNVDTSKMNQKGNRYPNKSNIKRYEAWVELR